MRYFLISDNADSAQGFRLAGVGGVVTEDEGEALSALRAAAADPGIGIILITDKTYARLKEQIAEVRASSPDHLIVGIPDRSGGAGSTDDMADFVRETVGIEI